VFLKYVRLSVATILVIIHLRYNTCIDFGMEITVNNKKVITTAKNLEELALELDLPKKGVAIAVEKKMVPSAEWSTTSILDGVSIIIIKAVCGG